MECKLKAKCPNKTDDLFNCWDADCDGWMHKKCCDLLLAKFEVPGEERPAADEKNENGEAVVFCKKGCYNKWWAIKKKVIRAAAAAEKAAKQQAKKRKVPWEEDGSLDTLMEWLTTEGNYAEYCGANGNKGKTKTQHHKELSILLRDKHPGCERNEKDVENKITSLERQFRHAADWANNTGLGVDNPGYFEVAIVKRCPLFEELEPIMGDRPNAKPLATSEDTDSSDDGDEEASGVADTAALVSMTRGNNEETDDTPPKKDVSRTSSLSSKSVSSSKRRMTASERPNKNQKGTEDMLSSYLGMNGDDGPDSFKELRVREVVAREREASARMLEAEAASQKSKTEVSLLNIQASATLLHERKKLLEEGSSQEEIDTLLPLKK